jgi:AcrR family transcriptional regulator
MNTPSATSYLNPDLSPRQRDLVKGALRLLDRDGLDGFTMRSLAIEIGLSPMAAYKHFDNQRELQLEVWSACMDALYQRTVEVSALAPDPAQAFLDLCREFVVYATTYPNRFELLFNHPFIREVRSETRLDAARFGVWEMANAYIAQAQESGRFRRDVAPSALAMAAYSMLHGLSYCLVSGRVRFTTAMEQDEAIRMGLMVIEDSLTKRAD